MRRSVVTRTKGFVRTGRARIEGKGGVNCRQISIFITYCLKLTDMAKKDLLETPDEFYICISVRTRSSLIRFSLSAKFLDIESYFLNMR